MGGGTRSADWNVCLAGLGLLGLVFWLHGRKLHLAPPIQRGLLLLVLALPLYLMLQLLPLPAVLLQLLSPERARVLASLHGAVSVAAFAPISVSPAETLAQLLRLCAYVIVFL